MSYTIKYQTDSEHGSELQKISKAHGWVEYLNTLGQVYYLPELTQQYYESRRQSLIDNMPAYKLNQGHRTDYIGWIYHLAQQRLLNLYCQFLVQLMMLQGHVYNAVTVELPLVFCAELAPKIFP